MSATCPCCGGVLDKKELIISDGGMVTYNGKTVHLPSSEIAILSLLAGKWPHMVSKQSIYDELYGHRLDDIDPKGIDVRIYRMRKALAPIGVLIGTCWGEGWYLSFDDEGSLSVFRGKKRRGVLRRSGLAMSKEEEAELLALMGRGYSPTAIAMTMHIPYKDVFAAIDRLRPKEGVV